MLFAASQIKPVFSAFNGLHTDDIGGKSLGAVEIAHGVQGVALSDQGEAVGWLVRVHVAEQLQEGLLDQVLRLAGPGPVTANAARSRAATPAAIETAMTSIAAEGATTPTSAASVAYSTIIPPTRASLPARRGYGS